MVFVFSSGVSLFWFLYKTFWFLEYPFKSKGYFGDTFFLTFFRFQFQSINMSLHVMIQLLTALFLLSFLVPGLVIINKYQPLNGLLLVIYGIGLCIVEQTLYEQEEGIFIYLINIKNI